jgi:hypothetical protein
MKHINEYEDKLADDMRGLNLAPKFYSYFAKIESIFEGIINVNYVVFIGDKWDEQVEELLELFNFEDIDKPVLEDAIKEGDFDLLLTKMNEVMMVMYNHDSAEHTLWKLQPKAKKPMVLREDGDNVVVVYELLEDYFVNFKSVIKQNPTGNA